jgi:hypothetical protein
MFSPHVKSSDGETETDTTYWKEDVSLTGTSQAEESYLLWTPRIFGM